MHAFIFAQPSEGAECVSDLLFNELVDVLDEQGDWLRVLTHADKYQGWIKATALEPVSVEPGEFVCQVLEAQSYSSPDLKSPSTKVSFGTRISASEIRTITGPSNQAIDLIHDKTGLWFERELFIKHPLKGDYWQSADLFLQTPYVWGGRSYEGIDCSGLVQILLAAYGMASPRDTKDQVMELGRQIDIADDWNVHAGDLVFMPGHVAISIGDAQAIHASGHSSQVVIQDLSEIVRERDVAMHNVVVKTFR